MVAVALFTPSYRDLSSFRAKNVRKKVMPAAISEEIHEKAKVIAIQVGYREAARQLDINENTILTWARREGWAEQVQAAREAILAKHESQGVKSAALRSPGDVLASFSGKSKLLAAKAGHSMLKTISKQKDLAQVALAQPFTQVVGALSKVHKWEEQGTTAVQVNVNLSNHRFEEA